MTIMKAILERARHTSVLGPFDVLDVSEAIRNAVSPHCTSLNPRDRQALAHLTYLPGLRGITRMLLAKLATSTATLPLPDALAMHLMDVNGDNALLPVIDDVQDAWLAAHRAAALRRVADGRPYPEDAWIVNSYASAWACDLTDVERAAMQDVAWDGTLGRCQVAVLRQLADRLIAEAPAPAVPPCRHTDVRLDLADVPHSITVEPVTPELRRGTELPADATLVVVERHAGRLAKVCNSTDAHVADYIEWGYNITIEDVARSIARTYGATYVETTPAVTA